MAAAPGTPARREPITWNRRRITAWYNNQLRMWQGDYIFLIQTLIAKDFKIRYRNMSLGVFWSLLNPLVMMGVMTFVLTKIFPTTVKQFPLFLLCGLVPYNFFSIALLTGTNSLVDNAGMIKRSIVPRETIPITAVLSNCAHLVIQIALLLGFVLVFGISPNRHWLWLPVLWGLEIVFVSGLALAAAPLNVFVRDTRYVVESANLVLMWLVPIFYDFTMIPQAYKEIYQLNPIAALILAIRQIVLHNTAPAPMLLAKFCLSSFVVLAIGIIVFRWSKSSLYDYV
jgi:ABC-type polysaccharide/polyol phosphate export permease